MIDPIEHGGPDGGPPILWDFSTNANVVEVPAWLAQAIQSANRHVYPDPAYTALKARLSAGEGVSIARIFPSAGGNEAIRRLTLAASLHGVKQVWVPRPGYAEYRAAAMALGLTVHAYGDLDEALPALDASASLIWLCEPGNPRSLCTGQASMAQWLDRLREPVHAIVAIDEAYEPLRLTPQVPDWHEVRHRCWRLGSPNKALGMTGIRAGWIVAPSDASPAMMQSAHGLAPSWVVSSEGVAMLMHWHDERTQQWLAQARCTLRASREMLMQALSARAWVCDPSDTNFFLARPPVEDDMAMQRMLKALRASGIKLRGGASFGLPRHVRLRAHVAEARSALLAGLDEVLP